MATIQDVVTELMKQTENSDITWKATRWLDDYTKVDRWELDLGDCIFSLFSYGVLSMWKVGCSSWITIGEGGHIMKLVELVDFITPTGAPIMDEYLQDALDCLQQEKIEN